MLLLKDDDLLGDRMSACLHYTEVLGSAEIHRHC
jgi:hypothetical protein